MLRPIWLGEAGLRYVELELASGGGLGQLLLREHLQIGSTMALVPVRSSPGAAEQFDTSLILTPEDGRERTDYVVNLCASFLAQSTSRLLIFEDASTSPTDPWLYTETWQSKPWFVCLDGVYYFAKSGASKTDIKQVITFGWGYPTIGVLADVSERVAELLHPQAVMPSEVLEEVAHHAEYLIIGAYDGTGMVIWSRTPHDTRLEISS